MGPRERHRGDVGGQVGYLHGLEAADMPIEEDSRRSLLVSHDFAWIDLMPLNLWESIRKARARILRSLGPR
eukprot:m.158259 g.158259  ORF g.158259 m.158259 type:complete len:71 (+) comp14502_c0_seq2:907-1119(+)